MKHWSVLFALAVFTCAALQAASPEEDYVQVYNQIQDADRLAQNQRPDQARNAYLQAQKQLNDLKRQYPDWNPNIIQFRLNYISRRLASLAASSADAPAVTPTGAPGIVPTVTPEAPAPEAQLEELRGRLRHLEREKADLSARLKEALAARPAAVDPHELEVAEARVLSQQKEIELLRVSLEKLKSESGQTPSAEGARRALTDAQRQINDQAEQIQQLSLERAALQQRLLALVTAASEQPAPTGTASTASGEVESLKSQMQSLHQQLEEERSRNRILVAEQRLIEERLKTTPGRQGDPETVKRLQSLERELDAARLANSTDAATISALQLALTSANHEIQTLQNRVRTLQPPSAQARLDSMLNPSAPAKTEPATVPAASTESPASNEDVAELKARLAMLEARRVPYSPEELALFRVPEVSASTNQNRRAVGGLSRDAALLITEAEKDLRAGRFEEAERKYQQALATDQSNVIILSSLASAQADQGNLAQAERTLAQAFARDPNDAFSLFVLGRVRLQQGRVDEAMTALSRSAYMDGSYANSFNLLGLALSQLGLREPAETALRRAVQIAPNYADAHYNLAVVYATQSPPSLGLAKWHYDKAVAGGHRPDPAIEARLKGAGTP